MAMVETYATPEPQRREIDATAGPLVLEFGTPWCGYCRAAQPSIATAFQAHPAIRHIKIEDGSGLPLGRSFRIKLWPTLVFIKDGQEVARLVRPGNAQAIAEALAKISA